MKIFATNNIEDIDKNKVGYFLNCVGMSNPDFNYIIAVNDDDADSFSSCTELTDASSPEKNSVINTALNNQSCIRSSMSVHNAASDFISTYLK